ncbi:hypothetical protein INT44_001668 [Umbelopsis vinacea]|uniref:Uncharacterized protein n=1 Tax=Umbelopsis vinacea TaxID=44442 RepID=A0A8H7PSM7_9FUNG|nr:hypothetical protein INT44_001668 [Umbelopsis vinacea]
MQTERSSLTRMELLGHEMQYHSTMVLLIFPGEPFMGVRSTANEPSLDKSSPVQSCPALRLCAFPSLISKGPPLHAVGDVFG